MMNYNKATYKYKDNTFVKRNSIGKTAMMAQHSLNKAQEALRIHKKNLRFNINVDKVVEQLFNTFCL